MSELAIGGIMAVLIGLTLAVIVGWGKFVQWRESVKGHTTTVMSRAGEGSLQHAPSAVTADARQTPDRRMIPKPTPEEMLDVFRVLRAAGVDREKLRPSWKAAGLPLDNNLWTQAAPLPPEEPQTITPIAGRPTDAKFHDPELSYQPPPR